MAAQAFHTTLAKFDIFSHWSRIFCAHPQHSSFEKSWRFSRGLFMPTGVLTWRNKDQVRKMHQIYEFFKVKKAPFLEGLQLLSKTIVVWRWPLGSAVTSSELTKACKVPRNLSHFCSISLPFSHLQTDQKKKSGCLDHRHIWSELFPRKPDHDHTWYEIPSKMGQIIGHIKKFFSLNKITR